MQSVRHAATELPFEHLSRRNTTAITGNLAHQPQVRPVPVPTRKSRKAPLLVRANQALRTVLVAMCGIAILGYGLDVAASNDVGKLQEQARRLSEQNTELSAQLLRVISFQGIQDSALGRFGLRVPEQVLIVKEVTPYPITRFEAQKHHLPLLTGY
jgi:hypothetical protein